MLATRKRPVEGYLLQQLAKPSKKNRQAGLFKQRFFSLDRDAGLLLFFSSHAQAIGGTPPKGSISLVEVEFVEELAKERPALGLLQTEKKDKKDKPSSDCDDVKAVGWQWPFVVHTISQGTHLILAPTAEVRDTWVVNLEEAIAEAKLRERKLKSKSQKMDAASWARERSESEVQADFLDILVFDSYVHELRKKENSPRDEQSASARSASYHPTPPLSPLNVKPSTKAKEKDKEKKKEKEEARAKEGESQAKKATAATSASSEWQTIQEMLRQESEDQVSEKQRLGQSHNSGAPIGSASESSVPLVRKSSRSGSVWRKEERKGSPAGTGAGANGATPVIKRRIGVRERTDTGDANVSTNASSDGAKSAGVQSAMPIKKSTSEETVARVKPKEPATNESEIEKERTKATEEQKNETNEKSEGETTKATGEEGPKRLSTGKRMYHTVRAPPRDPETAAGGLFGLSLHRRNLSMDLQAIVRSGADTPATPDGEKPTEASDDVSTTQKQEADEPVVELRIRGMNSGGRHQEPGDAESTDEFGSEFFDQMQFMQRRLSVIYQRMNEMEGDILAQQQQRSQVQPGGPEAVDNKSLAAKGSFEKKARKPSATAALLGREDRQAVRDDQEMLQAVVRREQVCRRLHRLVDNPVDHDVQFLVPSDAAAAQPFVIYGHRAIIRTRSSFFDKLFTQATNAGMDPQARPPTPDGPYMIPDTTRGAFLEVLSYLYSGNLGLTLENVQEVYKAAGTVHVRDLKAACRQFAARYAVTLPPRPTSAPYHLAKRQSVLDQFKNVNFAEARLAALATPEGVPSATVANDNNPESNSNSGGGGEDSPQSGGGKSRSKRMSQGLARVKNVLGIVSPRGSPVLAHDDKSEPAAIGGGGDEERDKDGGSGGGGGGSVSSSGVNTKKKKEETTTTTGGAGGGGGGSNRNSNNEKEAAKKNEKTKHSESESESAGGGGSEGKEEDSPKRLSGGLRGSFFSRSALLSKNKRVTPTQH